MNIYLEPVAKTQKPVLRRLFELYSYDFTEYNGFDLTECGLYETAGLDGYWTEAGRFPFFIRVDGKLAGFVLVNHHCCVRKESEAHAVAEFFVLKKYRRQGVGTKAANCIFDRFPGKWEISQHGKNLPSIAFWEKTVAAYTDSDYQTGGYSDDGVNYRSLLFDNSRKSIPSDIRLAEVTKENYWAVCSLDVGADQHGFVAPNGHSIAESSYEGYGHPLAVYNGDTLVGFGMTAIVPEDGRAWILRFMIDRCFQRMGFGREAFRLLLESARQDAQGNPVYLSTEPENNVARALYKTFGFEDTGELIRGELVMKKEFGT